MLVNSAVSATLTAARCRQESASQQHVFSMVVVVYKTTTRAAQTQQGHVVPRYSALCLNSNEHAFRLEVYNQGHHVSVRRGYEATSEKYRSS